VPERFIGGVRVVQGANVWIEVYPEPSAGRVARVSPTIDPLNRTFGVEITVPNADRRLRPGAFGRGAIVTSV